MKNFYIDFDTMFPFIKSFAMSVANHRFRIDNVRYFIVEVLKVQLPERNAVPVRCCIMSMNN